MKTVPLLMRSAGFALLLTCALTTSPALAASPPVEELDTEQLVLTWHKIANKPFDFDRHVNFSPTVAGPQTFDTPDLIKKERARLQAIYDAGTKTREFTTVVNDYFNQYDHARGEFPVNLFQPGIYVQYPYHYENYSLVFANPGEARAVKMPDKEEARAFDQQLQARGRQLHIVIKFRLIGSSDPQGAVTGERVMLAEILSLQMLDRRNEVVYAPQIVPVSEAPPPAKFVAANVDVAGMRLGVDANELKAALERLYSAQVERVDANPKSGNIDKRYAGYLEIDLMTCIGGGYRQRDPRPGDLCLRAWFDEDDVVRTIEVVRVHPFMDFEPIRAAAIARWGTVSDATGGGALMAWGPTVDSKLLNYKWPQHGYALTMHVGNSASDPMSGDSRPNVNITLQLTDPEWAASAKPLR
jgi:hypothetical protein